MNHSSATFVNVFPINQAVFGFKANWFQYFSTRLIQPSYLLMVLMIVIFIGIMVLKRFEDVHFAKKLWNIAVVVTVVGFWPVIVIGIKDLVDMFNTFLVIDVFQMSWQGFGFPTMGSVTNIFGWSAEGLARLLPNLSFWIIYSFYMLFVFFYVVLGPFVLAKGILTDEVVTFLDLIKEITNLFLWQTTVVILVALVMPEIVSGKPFPAHPDSNYYFLSFILGVLLLFVPSITRKFVLQLSSSYFPPGFRYISTLLGLSVVGKTFSATSLTPHTPDHHWGAYSHRALAAIEIRKRFQHQRYTQNLEEELRDLEGELDESRRREYVYNRMRIEENFLESSRKAKQELERYHL
ncbi:MAG: hypothetical protein KDD40_08335 [Bdellovibrionales bacterium]|nr:hypothetical protein [Bdellovibrionales bacterium]